MHHLFDTETCSLTYIVWDPQSLDAVVIDPVLDYDPVASSIGEESVQRVVQWVKQKQLKVHYLLETHAHADHLSGAQWVKKFLGPIPVAIGARIREVQQAFKGVYDLATEFPTDGRQFDRLLQDGERLEAGTLNLEVIYTPGHTPACCSYHIEDAVFTGDALFMPDYGTGRCDFPAGSAADLYRSITQRLYTLPPQTRVFTGHDYMPNGRPLRFQSTIAEERASNIQLRDGQSEAEYVRFRTERDKTLKPPKLLYPSVQVNVAAGTLPSANPRGQRFLKIPLFG